MHFWNAFLNPAWVVQNWHLRCKMHIFRVPPLKTVKNSKISEICIFWGWPWNPKYAFCTVKYLFLMKSWGIALENMHFLGAGPGTQNMHFTVQSAYFSTILGLRQNACRISRLGEMHTKNASQKCISIPAYQKCIPKMHINSWGPQKCIPGSLWCPQRIPDTQQLADRS